MCIKRKNNGIFNGNKEITKPTPIHFQLLLKKSQVQEYHGGGGEGGRVDPVLQA